MLSTEDLARKIAEDNSTADNRVYMNAARVWIKMVFDAITDEMIHGGSVRINNFGTFYLSEHKILNAHVLDGPKVVGKVPPFIRHKLKLKVSESIDDELAKLDKIII